MGPELGPEPGSPQAEPPLAQVRGVHPTQEWQGGFPSRHRPKPPEPKPTAWCLGHLVTTQVAQVTSSVPGNCLEGRREGPEAMPTETGLSGDLGDPPCLQITEEPTAGTLRACSLRKE